MATGIISTKGASMTISETTYTALQHTLRGFRRATSCVQLAWFRRRSGYKRWLEGKGITLVIQGPQVPVGPGINKGASEITQMTPRTSAMDIEMRKPAIRALPVIALLLIAGCSDERDLCQAEADGMVFVLGIIQGGGAGGYQYSYIRVYDQNLDPSMIPTLRYMAFGASTEGEVFLSRQNRDLYLLLDTPPQYVGRFRNYHIGETSYSIVVDVPSGRPSDAVGMSWSTSNEGLTRCEAVR